MAGMKKVLPGELFAAQINRGNLCVLADFGQATAILRGWDAVGDV